MGTRVYSEASNLIKRRGGRLGSNYRLQILYDGVTTANSGHQQNLPGNEIWVDSTGLYRLGLNFGPTFQNLGPASCEVFGSLAPKDYAQLINTQASLVTLMANKWKSLGVLTEGGVVGVDMTVYSLLRFVFAAGTHGEVVAVTL